MFKFLIYKASIYNYEKIVELLIIANVSLNIQDIIGQTAAFSG